ncbi:MoaD/ThiS family protein [bacterium]|nr:MoaD/ThiS family protein [bacterium]
MIIRYFAMLRDITHQGEQVWKQPTETVGELLSTHCDLYGPEFRRWIVDENGEFGGLSIVLVNGVDTRSLQGMDTQLKPEDIIAIFPPVAGG